MPAIFAKAVLHIISLLIISLIVLWILFYLHGTGFNSLLIPSRLRWYNGVKSQYNGVWYALSCAISYVELFGLLWLVNKFNFWFGQEWLKPTQMKIPKTATVVVGTTIAVCVAAFYIDLFTTP
jgi:hypothetical protein